MKIFTIILGARFTVLMKLVFRNGITPLPIYMIRFLMLLQGSLFTSLLIVAERIKFGRKTRETRLLKPPVFIVGHWRTGSTFLHQLLNLDPQFTTPTMVQTVIPDHFLFSTKYYVPILNRAMPKKRPMDNVALTPFEPQEEEFALLRMGSVSPVEMLLFPSKKHYFLKGYNEYIPEGRKLRIWKRNLLTLFRKITLETDRQIVSKNPFHTLRIALLAEMFPGARFIHIHRDPMVVVPSTIRMWNIVAGENCLKRGWKKPTIEETASVLRTFLDHVAEKSEALPHGTFTEVAFEALEKDPIGELKRIYSELDLPFTEPFQKLVNAFLSSNSEYRKNIYNLSEDESEIIRRSLARN